VISSPFLKNGSSYSVYLGGTVEGIVVDGLSSSGSYTPGSLASSFTIHSMVTGESTGMMGGGGTRGRGK
jgi:hypothetical protein